ncbi:MAG TPA: DUF4269 domain-containing protein, partial [Anaerolineales bacterium]|nr:DUF4269 domain-containing protein [Anaerolineales bacterium]
RQNGMEFPKMGENLGLAYDLLCQSQIFTHLREFHPVLTGTIPLDVDIPGSDLDILCEVYDFAPFAALIRTHYGHLPDFYQNTKRLAETPSHISRFSYPQSPFPFEIVAQPVPVTKQRAYRHLCAEARLLARGGDSARAAIRALKLSGMKTEPAFGQYFQLPGDPYLTLLDM